MVSLFSGALGLDLGLESAGFDVRVAVECDHDAAETIRRNRPDVALIEDKIEKVSTRALLKAAGLRVGETAVLVGGPSCQTFSTAGSRRSLRDPRGGLFRQFLRVVREARPRFFVMENVRGVLSAALSHRPLIERDPKFPPLERSEQLGSALPLLLREFRKTGYHVALYVLNAADFGVPQARVRVMFVGSRDGKPLGLPVPTHSRDGADGLPLWRTVRDAIGDLREARPDFPALTPKKARYLRQIPAGGNWRDLPARVRHHALKGAYRSWGGRSGFYRRLAWDAPSPAITTRPDCRATMFCHPRRLRPLSVRECARLQQFPDDWVFGGPRSSQYRQVGNAVPVGLGRAIGELLLRAMARRAARSLLGKVVSPDANVVARIEQRPTTVLNPRWMRKVRGRKATREWMPRMKRRRLSVLRGAAEARTGAGGREATASAATRLLRRAYGSPHHGNKADPLDELLYILLSQNTTQKSQSRTYDRLCASVGSWDDLLRMPARKLKRLLHGAGLPNQRSVRLKAIARRLRHDFGSVSLEPLRKKTTSAALSYLRSLPGVGDKTATCVLMYSLRRDVLPIDTHVFRIAKRLGLIGQATTYERARVELEESVAPKDRYAFHVNAIAHGRSTCVARTPRCGDCPLSPLCPSASRLARPPTGARAVAAVS